tara:strand:- start:8578 stop:9000 length:423 start_codon:yes stop_codon:yes gene_type:complete
LLKISRHIEIPENEVRFSFITSSGPGGQNVNKVSTAVQLYFDVTHSVYIPENIKKRLRILAGKKMTRDGVIIIKAQRFRSQDRNRIDALNRFTDLIHNASRPPQIRRPSAPSKSSIERRLTDKRNRSLRKEMRSASLDHE